MTTLTPNYRFVLPDFDQTGWDTAVNGNFTSLDTIINQLGFSGTWSNSTFYDVARVVIDGTNATVWANSVAHTTAPFPATFLAERTANPSYWTNITAPSLPLAGGAITGALSVGGTTTLLAGGSLTGSFSGNPTFTGAGTAITVTNSMLVGVQVQAARFTTGANAFAIASTALTPLVFTSANVSGTVIGAGAWNVASISSDTADFSAAADNSGKIWNIQYNFGGTAKGARVGIWSQMNPVSLTNAQEVLPVSANITAGSAMAGSFLQPFSSAVNVQATASAVGSIGCEFDYTSAANVVGIKYGLQLALGTGDKFQGLSADAGLFLANANTAGQSAGMANGIALGNTTQGFPIGSTGSVLSLLLQNANQGSGKNAQFIIPATGTGVDFRYLNTTIATGYSFRGAGFSVDGTGQGIFAQGLVIGRSGANYTIDVPSTFAVASVVPNLAGVPIVTTGSSIANYYPGDIVYGISNSNSQYQITQCQVVSAAVTAGGSGGTNGAQVVTLVGGTGVAATINVTVTGNAITAIVSVATVGTYNTFPPNLGAVPVTGAGLTGATLAVGMGAKTLAVLVPDVFATNITAITPTGGSGSGLTLTATNTTRSVLALQPSAGAINLGTVATVDAAGNATVATVKVGANQVVAARQTGWAAPTGTVARITFDQSTVTLPELAKRLAALIIDLTTHGLIGT